MSLHVVMGVSGCGKSSVARMLAEATGGGFLDADDFHTPVNRKKMADGIRLEDTDRHEWLSQLNRELISRASDPQPTFLACSALRRDHREHLAESLPQLGFIYLHGSQECIRRRMEARHDHFMPTALLESQFEILEEPSAEEALTVSIENPLPVIVSSILAHLQAPSQKKPINRIDRHDR